LAIWTSEASRLRATRTTSSRNSGGYGFGMVPSFREDRCPQRQIGNQTFSSSG
jgi:hypothetical protein